MYRVAARRAAAQQFLDRPHHPEPHRPPIHVALLEHGAGEVRENCRKGRLSADQPAMIRCTVP